MSQARAGYQGYRQTVLVDVDPDGNETDERKRAQKKMEDAVSELGGNDLGMGLAVCSFVFSLASAGVGAIWVAKLDTLQQLFFALGLCFVMGTSYTLVETQRNIAFADLTDHKGRNLPGAEFVRGQGMLVVVAHGSWLGAIGCLVQGVRMMGVAESHELILQLSSFYVVSSSLSLASVLRDRVDSQIWSEQGGSMAALSVIGATSKNAGTMAAQTCQRMRLMFLLCVLIGAVSVVISFTTIEIGGSGHMVWGGLLVMTFTGWKLAKAVQDDDDNPNNNATMASGFFFLIAVAFVCIGLMSMHAQLDERYTLFLAAVFFTDSIFSFAKVMHRHRRLESLGFY